MVKKLQIPGNEAAASTRAVKAAELGEVEDLPIEFEVQKVVDVADARDAGEQVLVPLEPLQPAEARVAGQIAEVEFDDGIKLWMRIGSLYRDFGATRARGATPSPEDDVWAIARDVIKPASTRAGARDVQRQTAIRRVTIYKWQRSEPASPQVAPAPPVRPASRGLAKDLLEGAVEEGLSGLAAGFIADRIADKVGRKAEKFRHGAYPLGLYKLNLEGDLAPEQAKDFGSGDDAAPILLFIHGTMSSFQGSFGSLWQTAAGASARKDFARHYRHAYALQHYTLTESPIDNALQLARALPQGTRLHLVTHSRGGLVGDLLCLGQREPWTAAGASLFASDDKRIDAEYKRQEVNLRELFALLEAKQIRVERYVRVACPSRGTTLASRRLDRWLSIFKLLGDVVPAAGLPLKFLLALIAEHEDPSTLPGLEAQTPGSPLIRTLNLPQLKVRADLTVISGDTESSGFLGRIKELALDQFFDDESDIIVNTGAMYGGLARVDGGRFHLERGAAVNHFAYFDNVASVRKLAEGLLRLDGSQAGFQPISEAKQKEPIARAVLQRAAPGPRPAVFILPGIMGSHLSIDDKRIWLAIGQLMLGGLGDLELNGADVKADPYLEDYYEELAEYLAQTHEVVRFPYDWRRSVMEAGERLAAAIAGKLDQLASVDQPVRIVAHSMGGLVVRAMIARHNDIWRRMIAHPRSRFVMLGTPNGGSHEIVRLLTGRATTLHNLALLDLRRGARGLLKIISGFPGVLELLPIVNNFECFDPQFWKDLRRNDEDQRFSWQPPKDADLRQARNARQEMEKVALSSERTVYVTGAAAATPVGYRLQTEFDYDGVRSHWQTLVFEANGLGDGQVPWQTGIPAGIKAWYLDDVVHGELPAHAPAFPAYVELLETGNTSRLSMTPPAGARATAASPAFDMPLELPPNLPDERDLAASVVGGRPPRRVRAPLRLPKAKVSITHGDLVFARYPVAVGHYRGDTIVSAEAYLDRALDHQLRNRSRLDLYPGALGTFEAFLQTDRYRKPGGAIVVGLGQVGELSPGRLASGFASAALSYALQVKECPDDRFGGAAGVPRHARITSLLIGTGAAGIAVRDSIASILRGVAAANRRLDEIGLSSEVWIDEIEFIELYQDIAIGAASALESTLLDGELSGYFICPERCICEGPGGRRRALFDSSPEWWSRLEIVYDKKRDELRFISLTDRARAEETLVAGQRLLADDFIRRSIRETRFDRDISRTLFEMLVPNRLKETAPNQDKLVLIVDDVSGSYPWELLEDRWSFGGKPVAVMSGMLRQLKTAVFRERPAMPFMNNAYVVGNPVLPAGELPGAEREAIAVADFLHKHGFAVTREIHSGAADILAGLHAEGYRVLHLAGHGVHEIEIDEQMPGPCALCEQPLPKTAKKISGMVIGKGIFLTPGDVEQMRYVPELVFINCCHLGNLGSAADATSWTRYSALAANLGAQFIRMGVKAVVAAGWAVDDSAAETFAISLYTHLFDADRFGDAVRAAREETFDKHGATNTWGAYQCYGDPSYRLRLPRDTESQRTPGPYVSPAQVVIDLDNLTSRARSTGGKIKDAQAIEQAVKKQRNDWLERAEVAAALGIAYGELGAFEDAIAHLGVALHAGKAEITVRAIEQRANFKTRLAVANVRKAKNASERHDATQLIDDAIADLNRLNEWDDWGTSIERLNLLGSSYKRKAQIAAASAGSGARSRRQAANARGQALRKMADYYRKSHEKVQEKDCRKFDPYPLLNWLTAEVLLAWPALPEKKKMKEIEGWLEQVKAYAEKENEPRDFWNSIVSADCDLLRALVGQTLVEDKDNIIKAFVGARRGGSPRELGSAREHLDFIAEILASADDGMNEQALALREIAERLANLPN